MKIITKKLGDKYVNQKGTVISMVDQFCGLVRLNETGQKIKLDQSHVETVIPSPGKDVFMFG